MLDGSNVHLLKIVYGIDILVCENVVNFRTTVDTTASQELMDGNGFRHDLFSTGNKVHNTGV